MLPGTRYGIRFGPAQPGLVIDFLGELLLYLIRLAFLFAVQAKPKPQNNVDQDNGEQHRQAEYQIDDYQVSRGAIFLHVQTGYGRNQRASLYNEIRRGGYDNHAK